MGYIENLLGIKKEGIYEVYYGISTHPKEYEKITRKKMIEEIVPFYQKPECLIRILTDHDIELLKKIEEEKDENLFNSTFLKSKYILDPLPRFMDSLIPNELKESIHAITSGDVLKEGMDLHNELILGLLYVSGPVPLQYLLTQLKIYLHDIDEETLFHHLTESPFFKIRTTFDGEKIYANEYEFLLEEELPKAQFFIKVFENKELIEIGNYKFNISNPKVKKFLIKYQDKFDYLINMIWENAQMYFQHFSFVEEFAFKTLEEKKDLKEVYEEIYSCTLHGLTPKEYQQHLNKKQSLHHKFVNISQVNAHLSNQDAHLFNVLYSSLLNFIRQEYDLSDEIIDLENLPDYPEVIVEARNILFKRRDLIQKYCNLNPDGFSNEELRLIKRFADMKEGIFTIVKYDEQFTYLTDELNLYGIKGITNNIQDILKKYSLPVLIKTCLLPFRNQIIYDGFLNPIPMSFGDGALQNILRDSKKRKAIYKITKYN